MCRDLQIAQVAGIMDEADVTALKQAALPKDFHDPACEVRILEVNGELSSPVRNVAKSLKENSIGVKRMVAACSKEVVDLERILLHGTSNARFNSWEHGGGSILLNSSPLEVFGVPL